MIVLSLILNLPWTILGLLEVLVSVPVSAKIHHRPFAFIVTVRSFWWQTWLSSYKGVRATTTGNVVLLGQKLLSKDLEHELVHVEQYTRAPFIHPLLYVLESWRHGYRSNKYEIEAYERARNKYVSQS